MKLIVLTAALLFSAAASAQMAHTPSESTAAMPMEMPMQTSATTQTAYPPCSATVLDQCLQSNARESDTKGGPPANMPMMRHHRMMKHHHRMMRNHKMKM